MVALQVGGLLPWVALAVLFSAQYIRVTRSNMLETFGEDFMRTARSKGLSRRRIVTACRAAGSRAITPMPPPRHWPRRPGEPIEMSLAVATVGGASIMNHDIARLTRVADRPGPAVGDRADLLLVDGETPTSAVVDRGTDRTVLHGTGPVIESPGGDAPGVIRGRVWWDDPAEPRLTEPEYWRPVH